MTSKTFCNHIHHWMKSNGMLSKQDTRLMNMTGWTKRPFPDTHPETGEPHERSTKNRNQ